MQTSSGHFETTSGAGRKQPQHYDVYDTVSERVDDAKNFLAGITRPVISASFNSRVLASLCFISSNRHRPGILLAAFLLIKGWTETEIGYALFVCGIATLLFQAPMGQIVDVWPARGYLLHLANLITVLASIIALSGNDFGVILLAMFFQGIANSVAFPSLYSLTIKVVGSAGMVEQVPINEAFTHFGNVAFLAIGAFFILAEMSPVLFFVCAGFAILSSLVLFRYNDIRENFMPRTDQVLNAAGPEELVMMAKDVRLSVFFGCMALYHITNSCILPLLAQAFANEDNEDPGYRYIAASVIVSQLVMGFACSYCKNWLEEYSTKKLIIIGFALVPVRGVLLWLFTMAGAPNTLLLLVQILDGVSGALVSVVGILMTEELMRETGHFAFGIATFKTMEALGVSISHIFAHRSLEAAGYHSAFLVVALIGAIPLYIYHKFVPEAEDLSDLKFPSSTGGRRRGTRPAHAGHEQSSSSRDYSVDESIDSSSAQLTRL